MPQTHHSAPIDQDDQKVTSQLQNLKKKPLDFRKYAQQIWLAGLGAFVRAEEEGNKLFDTLVKVGEELEAKSLELADQTVGKVSGKAKESVGSVIDTKDKMERLIDQGIQQSLHKMGLATAQDVAHLEGLLRQMSTQLDVLIEENQQLRQQLQEK